MRKSPRNFEAIVLKKVNYGDADRIYTLFTRELGKVSALAKGVRKITSRRSGNLDTLNLINVSLSESTSALRIISEVTSLNSFKNLKTDFEKSLTGYYFAELVDKSVTDSSETTEVFDLLKEYLEKLNEGELKVSFLTNKFEVLLMKLLGYGISLEELRNFGRTNLDARLKDYVKDKLGEDFKSLRI